MRRFFALYVWRPGDGYDDMLGRHVIGFLLGLLMLLPIGCVVQSTRPYRHRHHCPQGFDKKCLCWPEGEELQPLPKK